MPANNPFRCSYSAMAQRGANEVVLLDTGAYPGFSKLQNATFTWNGTDWTHAAPATSPTPKRTDFALSYDGYNVIMFGGREQAAGPCQDTWSWNGTTWAKLAPTTVPFARFQAEMAFLNAAAPKAVMFGGASMLDLTNETWVWNGHSGSLSWTKASSTNNPSARTDFAFAGGPVHCALFGGKNGAELLGDTWKFDGTQWTQMAATTPPPAREGMSMAYDSVNTLWVLFGGGNGYDLSNETYTLNSAATAWTKRAPATSPSARRGAMMCFDTVSGMTILTGGSDSLGNSLNDTWAYDGSAHTWTQL